MSGLAQNKYVGRLAPTPSGFLHKGHAFTFGIACYRAQLHSAGKLYLRIEDLDRNRCKPRFADAIVEDLKWLGLSWDVPTDVVGAKSGIVYQSEKLIRYQDCLKAWATNGWIYPSEVSRKQLRNHPGVKRSPEGEFIFPKDLRNDGASIDDFDWNNGDAFRVNWRWRVDYGSSSSYQDGRLGEQSFVAGLDYGDFLVWSKDGFPSYEMAVVLDDLDMRITEVVRGEDLLVSTARQLELYRRLDHLPPDFYHCPLVCDEAGVRLAKSYDSESIRSYREWGFSPEDFWKDLSNIGLPDVADWLSSLE